MAPTDEGERQRRRGCPHHRIQEKGPRGEAELSAKLAKDIENLMLLCLVCHRTIDRNKERYPVDLLREMKRAHERRIHLVASIHASKKRHVVLYGANVGDQGSPLTFDRAAEAMFPDAYPADREPLSLGMVNSTLVDRDREFWAVEQAHLKRIVNEQIKTRLIHNSVKNVALFAIAPQPLLMVLGSLLTDIPAIDTFQLHREPADWKWRPASPTDSPFRVVDPPHKRGTPALVLAISATIDDRRITSVLKGDVAIWKITVDRPHSDVLQSREQLSAFRQTVRTVLDRLKSAHGEGATIHLFPAAPVAIAVEMGRVVMPKADLPLRIYDQNRGLGGFVHALDLGATSVPERASS